MPDANGRPVRLSELLSKKAVVLYFYPKDETAGCTAETCAFRDAYDDSTAAGAEVVGVSRERWRLARAIFRTPRAPLRLVADPAASFTSSMESERDRIPARQAHSS